jgi:hypothetical protein
MPKKRNYIDNINKPFGKRMSKERKNLRNHAPKIEGEPR